MNWADLEVILALSRHSTLGDAAAALQLNASTVSRRVRALEEALGVPLVEQVGNRLVLTQEGEKAVATAAQMEAQTHVLTRQVSGAATKMEGVIRFGALDMFAAFHLDTIARFHAAHPRVRIELISDTRVESLAKREIDVAFRVTTRPAETLVGRKVLSTPYAIFAAPVHDATSDVSALPYCGWSKGLGARVTDAWMEQHLAEDQVVFRCNQPMAMLEACKAGVGAALLPIPYARAAGGMVQRSPELDGFETDIWILTHRDLHKQERIKQWMGVVSDALVAFGDAHASSA